MGKSSKDKRDAYYRMAKEEGWRARSAFKLIQLNEQFDLFTGATRVVDLCAAPGSWSQVLSRELILKHGDAPRPRIVAVDLQPIAPLEGIITLQLDITHPNAVDAILEQFGSEPADLVICDGAPDVTGLHDLDEYVQAQLLLSAYSFAARVLRHGGKFVAKIFRGKDIDLLYAQLSLLFKRVTCAKPRASRASSLEAFVVCEDFSPPPGFDVGEIKEYLAGKPVSGAIVPFLACGDLNAPDSDATHAPIIDRDGLRRVLDAVQPPVDPPYKKAIELRRAGVMN